METEITDIGKVAITPRKDYKNEQTYEWLDVVTYDGAGYMCIAEEGCTGIVPTNTDYWQLLADKGHFTEEDKEEFKKAVVEESKTEINEHTGNKKTELNNYTTELEKSLENELDTYKTEKETQMDSHKAALETEMANKKDSLIEEIETAQNSFDTNAEEKTNTFNSNVETKTTEFNNNSTAKTEEFNNNSTEKINNFNSNAEEKIADYNEHVETLTSRIADLEEETDDLFNALNTEKASGTELYIDDAKACRVISSEIDGMYQQETTSGITKVTTTSYSATYSDLTIETDNNNIFTFNGTPSENINKMDVGFINGTYILQPGDNYCHIEYLSGTLNYADSSIKNGFILNIRGTGTQIINANNNTTTVENYKTHRVKKFTLTEEEKITLIQIMTQNNLTFNNLKLRIWWSTSIENLYEPYTGGVPSPSPDYPQAIEQVESVNFVNTRKNILPSDFIGKTITSNASLKNIKVKPGKDYYMTLSQTLIEAGTGNHPMSAQHFRKFIDKDGKVISSANFGIMTFTSVGQTLEKIVKFTIPQNCVTIELDIGTYYSSSAAIKTNYYQLEEGSTATEYEPYQNQTINIDLQGNKLCAISDTIKDKLLIDRNGNVALQKNVLQGFIDGTTAKSYITKLNDDKYVCAQMKTAFTDVLLNSRIISNLLLQPKKVGNRLALR